MWKYFVVLLWVCNYIESVKICQTPTDLAFILDTSGSVGSYNFEKIKTFVKNVTDFFKIGTNGTRVAVVTYSSWPFVEFNLGGYISKTSLKNAVSRLNYRAGWTYTGDALEVTRTDVFNTSYGMRPDKGIPKVAVLLTDGYSNGWGVTSAANALKNLGVHLFCIGVGNYNRKELNDIASDPDSAHVFTMHSFNDLSSWVNSLSSVLCIEGGCGDPGTPENGNRVGISYSCGKEVSFSCDIGYARVGSEQRRCLPNNTWSGTQPTCKRLSCGPAPTVRNADLNLTGTNFNATVVYTCQPGFTMNGDNVRRCTAKGAWSGIAPNCTTQFCMRTMRASRTRCTAKCSPNDPAECPAGHKCLCDGQCGYSCVEQGLQCPVPSQVTNGFITYKGTGYNDALTYGCKRNYTLNGDRIRRCTAKKKWSGAAPSCLPDCGRLPPIPRHAYIENKKSKYASGDRVTYNCVDGYNREGIATTLCFMGRWNVMPFRCDIVDCGSPKKLGNGTITGSETTFQKSISFKCDEGFELDGTPNAICQSDGKWSNAPTCKLRTRCGDPGTPINGIKKGLSFLHGSLVFFSCNFGYKIVGSMTRQCLPNNKWSGVQPTCKRLVIDCGQPVLPYNSYIGNKKSKYLHGESVTFKCKKGFLPVGIDMTHCFMGRWSAVPFSCVNTKF